MKKLLFIGRSGAVFVAALLCAGRMLGAGNSAFVDPFIGTSGSGHCNPGAALPFSFVKPGPDTGNGSWAYCGGYRYEDKELEGFSQTHLSGVGRAEMGDVLLLPFTGEEVRRRVPFTHEGEVAVPGYYAVTMDEGKVRAELTATRVVAFHRYTFATTPARLIVDFQHGLTSVKKFVATHVLTNSCAFGADKRSIQGMTRVRKNWPEHSYYYSIVFDKPIEKVTRLPAAEGEKGARYVLDFDLKEGEALQVKVAFSMNSVEKAVANGRAELPGWDFEGIRAAAAAEWESLLSRVELETPDLHLKRSFYTALYHAFLHPDNVADVGEVPRYSTFSLWDTFRAAHPLYTLLVPERVEGFVGSILDFQKTYGYLPIWMMWGREGYCMIGNHAVPVLLDAWKKGFKFDYAAAYEAVRTSLLKSHPGDATGNIGQYAHGNEPCHHVAWLYALLGERQKTVGMVDRICRAFYKDTPDGLCGNDDCGQMSAWYVFATLGFYPYNPASGEYVLGAPRVPRARLHFRDGKSLTIVNKGTSSRETYPIVLNGDPQAYETVSHAALLKGGELLFQ